MFKIKESTILAAAMRLLSVKGYKVFRNNCGTAIYGKAKVRYGIGNPGGSDIIGYKSITITQDMVGKKIAQFVAIECKTLKGKLSPQQERFLKDVEDAGGMAKMVNDIYILNSEI